MGGLLLVLLVGGVQGVAALLQRLRERQVRGQDPAQLLIELTLHLPLPLEAGGEGGREGEKRERGREEREGGDGGEGGEAGEGGESGEGERDGREEKEEREGLAQETGRLSHSHEL